VVVAADIWAGVLLMEALVVAVAVHIIMVAHMVELLN
jgi:hypothetical protein